MTKSHDSWLTSASREDKERLLRSLLTLEDEKNRLRLKNYLPNPGWQTKFYQSQARIRFVPSGNQGGKTHAGAVEHALYALGEHPHKKIRIPNKGIIVTAKSFKDGIQNEIIPKLEEVVGSRDITQILKAPNGIPDRIFWRSGSKTFLMSAEQDDIAFESKTFDHAWIDEPVRRQVWVGLRRGLMKAGGHIWLTATLLEEPWIYEEIYMPGMVHSDPDIEIFEGATDENIHIPKEEAERFFRSLTEDEVETRRFGRPSQLSGRVFKEYKPDIHRINSFDVPAHWPVWRSIDPHPRKPHAVLYIAVAPQAYYICNEVYLHCDAQELAAHIQDLDSQYNMVGSLIDTSSQEAGWGKMSFREELAECGIRTQLAQKKNLKKSGLILINSLFKQNKLFVMNHCVRTHRELTLQTYKKSPDYQKVSEEPEKKFDDMTDNLRYILVERPDARGQARIYQSEIPYVRGM